MGQQACAREGCCRHCLSAVKQPLYRKFVQVPGPCELCQCLLSARRQGCIAMCSSLHCACRPSAAAARSWTAAMMTCIWRAWDLPWLALSTAEQVLETCSYCLCVRLSKRRMPPCPCFQLQGHAAAHVYAAQALARAHHHQAGWSCSCTLNRLPSRANVGWRAGWGMCGGSADQGDRADQRCKLESCTAMYLRLRERGL